MTARSQTMVKAWISEIPVVQKDWSSVEGAEAVIGVQHTYQATQSVSSALILNIGFKKT